MVTADTVLLNLVKMTRHFISHLNQPLNLNFPEASITLLSLSLLLIVVRGNSGRQPQVLSAPNCNSFHKAESTGTSYGYFSSAVPVDSLS